MLMVSVLGHTAVLNTLTVSGVSAGVLSCLTSNACQQGKPAGFTHGKHGCIQEPVAKILFKFKT